MNITGEGIHGIPSGLIQNGSMIYAADAGSTDTYAITLSPAPGAYTTGMMITFKANTANTGAATLNVNSLGAKNILKNHDQTLATGDIEAAQMVTVVYDGTQFQMQSQSAQGIEEGDAIGGTTPAAGTFTTINATSIGATTTPTIRSLLDEDAEIVTADATLTANQCSGGLISNYNQSLDCTVTVPTAFAGGNFMVILSTAVAKYYRLDPTGSEVFVYDGTALTGGYYVGIAAATVGAALQFVAVQTGASAYTWHVYTVCGAWAAQA